jgi:hypothetical protein
VERLRQLTITGLEPVIQFWGTGWMGGSEAAHGGYILGSVGVAAVYPRAKRGPVHCTHFAGRHFGLVGGKVPARH